MQNVSVARRYARALLELANESGTSEKVHAALSTLAGAIESSPELQSVFVDPSHSRATRALVMDQLLAATGSKDLALVNTLKLLNDRDRLGYLPAISRLFGEMADERAGRVRGQVTSAAELSKEALKKLEKSLETITQRHVVLDARVDKDVLGGASAQVGSLLFDGTLRNQLDTLRRDLKGR